MLVHENLPDVPLANLFSFDGYDRLQETLTISVWYKAPPLLYD